jgi:hypothetical protein
MSFLDFFSTHPKNQLSARAVQWMLANLDGVQTEILQFVEPGREISIATAPFILNVMAEFRDDRLAIVYGKGSGHAFLRVSALRDAKNASRTIGKRTAITV